ncbi:MAG TPA: hypothetical protein VF595_06140 [Tepidisphaeraceae bacterium]|jgi:hypothetical protein
MPTLHSAKFARLFVTPAGGTAQEVPFVQATVNPGKADRIRYRHSMSEQGTDVDTGMKSEAEMQFVLKKDYAKDPFGTTLKMRGGEILDKLELYEYDPAQAATPSGVKHVYEDFQLEDSVTSVNIEGETGLQFSGCSSTKNYEYVPDPSP